MLMLIFAPRPRTVLSRRHPPGPPAQHPACPFAKHNMIKMPLLSLPRSNPPH